jgi:hypothetical protein
MVAPFWDDLYDLDILSTEGDILYYNDEANNRFIIQWDSIAHNINGTEPQREIFQAILLNPAFYPTLTGDGEIIFQYRDVKLSNSNTIGIENHAQDIGLQYVFNNSYDATASELINELAIKFTTEQPFVSVITSVDEKQPGSGGYSLGQSHPNPFNSQTWIDYTLPEQTHVNLSIFDISGKLVSTLQSGQQLAGKHSVMWNALDDNGNPVMSGIYFYRLHTEGFVDTKKMFLLK